MIGLYPPNSEMVQEESQKPAGMHPIPLDYQAYDSQVLYILLWRLYSGNCHKKYYKGFEEAAVPGKTMTALILYSYRYSFYLIFIPHKGRYS